MGTKATDAESQALTNARDAFYEFIQEAIAQDTGLEGDRHPVLAFDGADDYVQITGYQGVTGNGPRTAEAWIKTTASNGAIVSWGRDAPSEKWVFGVQSDYGTPHTIGVDIGDGYIVGATPVNDGKWHHVACTMGAMEGSDSKRAIILYVDGAPEKPSASVAKKPIRTAADADLKIGTDFNHRYFQGEIAEVRVWNKARTHEEIRADMQAPLQGDKPGLVGYWSKAEQGKGNLLRDRLARQGTLKGAEWKEALIGRRILAPVAKTGQTKSYGPGDDGDLQKGIPWPEPRFTDNGDGTVTDLSTGLVWFKNAGFPMGNGENEAINFCKKLKHGNHGLWDGSAPGDWRLPGVKELLSLMDYSRQSPALPPGHPFRDIDANDDCWAAEIISEGYQFFIKLKNGRISGGPDTRYSTKHVLPVRGKQNISWPAPRFTDNGDGTMTDPLTGLVWLKDKSHEVWIRALDFCNKLADGESGLSDGSFPGDWRLPNIREMLSITYYPQRNDGLLEGNPFYCGGHKVWSSTSVASDTSSAWTLRVESDGCASMYELGKTESSYFFPVRERRGQVPKI